jgi:23S rRNA pseudouridine2605 synthase
VLADTKRTHLNRALSKLGLCSRGVAALWIAEGRVSVNGIRAEDPEQWVDLGKDRIQVAPEDGASVVPNSSGLAAGSASGSADDAASGVEPASGSVDPTRPRVYLILNKPAGFVTTRSDELGRKTVYDLLPEAYAGGWLFPVGRLDKDSEGLLLMTDDGEWSNLLTDPDFHVEKIYRVKLDAKPREEELRLFRAGIVLDGSATLPAGVEPEGGSWYRVRLTEGRNRQIRRMFHELGYKVKRLVRVAIGDLELGDLAEGAVSELPPERVEGLRAAARAQGSKGPG